MRLLEAIWNLNRRYDQMQEPWRFLTMLVIATPVFTTGLWVDEKPLIAVLCMGWAGLLLACRIPYVHRKK